MNPSLEASEFVPPPLPDLCSLGESCDTECDVCYYPMLGRTGRSCQQTCWLDPITHRKICLPGYYCECSPGYHEENGTCLDNDECTNQTPCGANASCVNTEGSYECHCNPGYEMSGTTCVNIDECKTATHNCSPLATCADTIGSFTCTCMDGSTGDGVTCTGINECEQSPDPCGGGYTCEDRDPPTKYVCHDIIECNAVPGPCGPGYNCVNTIGSYQCQDIKECSTGAYSCPAHSSCSETNGGYDCICNPGYRMANGLCEDIPECAEGLDNCNQYTERCDEAEGSFVCIGLCDQVGESCCPNYNGLGVYGCDESGADPTSFSCNFDTMKCMECGGPGEPCCQYKRTNGTNTYTDYVCVGGVPGDTKCSAAHYCANE